MNKNHENGDPDLTLSSLVDYLQFTRELPIPPTSPAAGQQVNKTLLDAPSVDLLRLLLWGEMVSCRFSTVYRLSNLCLNIYHVP